MNLKVYDTEIPYYINCLYPSISAYLKSKDYDISVGILTNYNLFSVITFSVDKTVYSASVDGEDVFKLNHNYFKTKLGLTLNFKEIDEHGKLEYLRDEIQKNNNLIVCGTSYYLPYSKDYYNQEYINKILKNGKLIFRSHCLMVTGVNSSTYQVYDPIPNQFYGELCKEDLHNFWKGYRNIQELCMLEDVKKELANGVCHVNIENESKLLQGKTKLILNILHEITKLNLYQKEIEEENRTYYYGIKALKIFKEYYTEIIKQPLNRKEREELWKCFFDLKYSFHFYRLLLEELTGLDDVFQMEDAISKVDLIIEKSIKMSNIIQANQLRGNPESKVQSIIQNEFEQIIDIVEMLNVHIEDLFL